MSTRDSEFLQFAQAQRVEEEEKSGAVKSKRSPQNAKDRVALRNEFESALSAIDLMESEAGPTLKAEFTSLKRFQAAREIYGEQQSFILRRLGQRSGLLRLMERELEATGISTGRADLYVEHMLRISANIAALSGSGWPSVWSWIRSRLPMTVPEMEKLKTDFAVYLSEARDELARRIPTGDPNLHTGPTPAGIAIAFSTTTEQIRQAKANTCGLTSIDPQDRKLRDRERQEAKRRKDGRKPQAQRTSKADLKTLAERLGCSLATVYRKRLDGTLDAFVAAHDGDETDVSTGIREIDGRQISLTDGTAIEAPQVEAEQQEVKVNDALMRVGFIGRNISLDPAEIERLGWKFPHLREGMLDHLAKVDHRMNSTPKCYGNKVRDTLLRHWNRDAGKAKLKVAA